MVRETPQFLKNQKQSWFVASPPTFDQSSNPTIGINHWLIMLQACDQRHAERALTLVSNFFRNVT